MGGKSEERKISEQQLLSAEQQLQQQLEQQLAQLRGRELGQEEARQRAIELGQVSQAEFERATEESPESITRLQEIIRERALPEQQQALRRTKLSQAQAGVRGPEAALQQSMVAGRLGKELALDAEQLALQENLRRQRSREQLAGQKQLSALAQQLTPVQKVIGESPLEKQQKEKITKLEEQTQKLRRLVMPYGGR